MRASRWFAPVVLIAGTVVLLGILYVAYVALSLEYMLGAGIALVLALAVVSAVAVVWWWFAYGPDRGPDPPSGDS